MESCHLDFRVDKSPPEIPSNSSISSYIPETCMFEDPFLHPRVGDEYQAKIPPMLLSESKLKPNINTVDYEFIDDSSHSFLMGLPIPVMWVYDHASPIKDEILESENITMSQTCLSNRCCVVPGIANETWSDFEANCFLLGLYIFGKNLLQVKRFMESKDMVQILCYYYGQFHGSAAYCTWSKCRKVKNRKCILGHRLFTGYRQQKLLSRLLPRLSEELRPNLFKASRSYAEGSSSLDEYVSSLKALIGIHGLVEAIAIGNDKEDLTTLVMDSKDTQMFTYRPEIYFGKVCSSLTCGEIVKYLTGDIRLSKARSNDLFWEAVWPRLLARGWHSEQPKDDVYAFSKSGLVFLVPGIKKFSRRKLTKGDHYFDSVTSVLAKIASKPELLVLETDETKPENPKEETSWNSKNGKVLSNDEHERHYYLKHCLFDRFSSLAKLTVDTKEEKCLKMRKPKSLPLNRLRNTTTESEGDANMLSNGLPSSDVSLLTDPKSRDVENQLRQCRKQVQSTKRRKLESSVHANVTFVLGLPALDKNVTRSKKVPSVDSSVACTSDEKMIKENANSSPTNGPIAKEQIFDLNLPQVLTESEGDAEEMSENMDTSDTNDAQLSCAVDEPTNKDGREADQQTRRHSTRNRPLTTKALEALEVKLSYNSTSPKTVKVVPLAT